MNAAETPLSVNSSVQLQPQYQLHSETRIILSPIITAISPSTCVRAGSSLQVSGRDFPARGAAGVALGGNSQHLDVEVKSWNTTQLEIVLPASGLQPGKRYYIGVERLDHGQWLSNINQSVQICETASSGLSRGSLSQRGYQIQGRTGFATSPPKNESPAVDPDTSESVSELSPPAINTPRIPYSGGSLISAGLPPPPVAPVLSSEMEERGIEPGELLMLSADMDEARLMAQQLAQYGMRPIRRQQLAGLGLVITAFKLPPDDKVAQRLQSIRKAHSQLWGEANHHYQLQATAAGKAFPAHQQIGWRTEVGCGQGIRMGMIDAAVDTQHVALKGQAIMRRSFITPGMSPASAEHGTSIAIQLAGAVESEFPGMLPGASLYVAEVFRNGPKQKVATTTEWVILALDWLVQQQVSVINMSLGGPRNLLLEKVIERVVLSGISVVAAAGNQGPKALPVYPAAQEEVVSVTAIDQARAIYPQANQGDYIDFAAPGVDVRLARLDGRPVFRSGTSYATPFVAALLAYLQQTTSEPQGGLAELRRQAIDLGTPGQDPVFGWGLVQASVGCPSQ